MATTTARQIFRWHSRLGRISSLFVLSFFLSGAVIVFNLELEKYQHPEMLTVTPGIARLSYDSIYRSVQQQRPDLYLYSFRRLPAQPDEALEMRVYDPNDHTYPLLFVNPYNGKVTGVLKQSVYGFFITLHYTFHLGKTGELLAAIFAFALLGSIITGMYVYRKHLLDVLLFKVVFRYKNWRTFSSSLHRIIGVWALFFNFILAVSGAYMMLYAFNLKQQFGASSDFHPVSPPRIHLHLDDVIRNASGQLPGFQFTYLDFPRTADANLRIMGDLPGRWWLGTSATMVEADLSSGKIKRTIREDQLSIQEQFEYGLYTLHYGQYGGLPLKILYSFFGLAGSVLIVTGWLLWIRRKK